MFIECLKRQVAEPPASIPEGCREDDDGDYLRERPELLLRYLDLVEGVVGTRKD